MNNKRSILEILFRHSADAELDKMSEDRVWERISNSTSKKKEFNLNIFLFMKNHKLLFALGLLIAVGVGLMVPQDSRDFIAGIFNFDQEESQEKDQDGSVNRNDNIGEDKDEEEPQVDTVKTYKYQIESNKIIRTDLKTSEVEEVVEITEAAGGDPIEIIMEDETGQWIAYGVARESILNVGGEVIGTVYEWQVYNSEHGGVVILNGRTHTSADQLTFEINKALKWIGEAQLLVIEDGGMTYNGVAIYEAEEDIFRDLTEQELIDNNLVGLF